MTIDELLAEARAELGRRPVPADLPELRETGAVIVDIRPIDQRMRDGELPDAVVVDRNVLEWRTDLWRGRQVVLVCDGGYASSLAAVSLRRLGIDATDLDGGYQAWLTHR